MVVAVQRSFVTLRTTIGLTRHGLATLLGVSSKAVENWEQGLTSPKAQYLRAFLALCVQASAFASGHEEEQICAFWQAARQKEKLKRTTGS
jgi:transcriptional regulator with XRE-family HTH domain